MQQLSDFEGLIVRQRTECPEIVSGYETSNRYVVTDISGNDLFTAAEVRGSVLLRLFLRARRPFEMDMLNWDGRRLMHLKRRFRLVFHELEVYDGAGVFLGRIKKRFSVLRRIYTVFDAAGGEMFELFGPVLHPWTFEVRREGVSYGKITKKWSGMLKEGFTDADNFGITFSADWDTRTRAVLLGAVFLIDFVHFENKNRN